MARPKATPEQRKLVRRSIQSAAADLYRAKGIAAISARAVATKAGVSVGTIYSYFGDLAGLMQSLWTGRVAEQEKAFQSVAAQHADPIERVQALLEAYIAFGLEQDDLYRGTLMFVRPTALETPEKQPLSNFAFPTVLREAIEQGQAAGQIVDGDPAILTQVLWSGVHGALALPINLDRLELKPAAEIAAPVVDGLLRAVRNKR